MHSLLLSLAILGCSTVGSAVHASQVFTFGWDKFHVEAGGVEIWGTQNEKGISSLKIKVFNRKFVLSESQLRELDGFSANGLRIYNASGYAGQGGEAYYVCFYTESDPTKRTSKMVKIEQERGVKIENGSFH